MQPGIVIRRLLMRVDPEDSSYFPSVVAVSVGDSVTSLRELAIVNIMPNDTTVSLLLNATEVNIDRQNSIE